MRPIHFLLTTFQQAGPWIYGLLFFVSILESLAFIGLFVPGTTIIIVVGIFAAQGRVGVVDLMIPVIIGSVIGDAISFYLGRQGTVWFTPGSRWFKLEYLDKGVRFFERNGNKSVVLARFIGPLRPVIPFVAGLTKMRSREFFLYNITSALLFAPTYILFGYFFGQAWERARHLTGTLQVLFLGLIVAVAAILIARKEEKILNK